MVVNRDPIQTTNGFVQSGEMIRAKIDMTDPVTRTRCAREKNRVYIGVNQSNHVVVLDPFTNQYSTLFLNRMRKI